MTLSLSTQKIQEIAALIDFDLDIFPAIAAESPTLLQKLELVQYWYENDQEEFEQFEREFPPVLQIQRNVELEGTGGSRFIKLQLNGIFFEVLTPNSTPIILKFRKSLPKGYMAIALSFRM